MTQALTLPTTRSLCDARGTVLYITKALDLFTGSGFKGQQKTVGCSFWLHLAATYSLFISTDFVFSTSLGCHKLRINIY